MQVSHLHPEQQRLVAHGVLVDAEDLDAVEPVLVVDQDPLSLGQDGVVGAGGTSRLRGIPGDPEARRPEPRSGVGTRCTGSGGS